MQAETIDRTSGRFIVWASSAGHKRAFEADMVVHGAGRVAEIDDLGLEVAGVEWDDRGVKVNEYLQSVSNPAVYAAGDAAATRGAPLTPVAGYEGQIVASNLLKGNHQKPDYAGIPTVVFTTPPLVSVGLQERTAEEQGLRFTTKQESTSNWYSSRRVGERCSGYKVLVEEGTDRILGAHLLGGHADEIINLFALAIRSGLRATELKHMLFAYPTHGSDVPYML
jgi:glutathione reductase (NADPH)